MVFGEQSVSHSHRGSRALLPGGGEASSSRLKQPIGKDKPGIFLAGQWESRLKGGEVGISATCLLVEHFGAL